MSERERERERRVWRMSERERGWGVYRIKNTERRRDRGEKESEIESVCM